MTSIDDGIVVEPGRKMTDVLQAMQETDSRRVLVAEGDSLRGIISSTDIAGWVQRSRELEELIEPGQAPERIAS